MSMMAITAARQAAAFAPPFRSSVALWLDLTSPDTSIVSGAVAQIGDRSGNARHFSQATDTKRPTYTASDPDFGGRPSMTFDGVDDFLSNAALPAWPQMTVAIVAHGGALTGRRYLDYGGGSGGVVTVQNDTSIQVRLLYFNTASTVKTRTITAAATRRIVAAFDSSVGATAIPELYLDGVDQGTTYNAAAASNGPMTGTRTMALGATFAGTSAFFDDKIADVIVYDRALSGAEIATVDAWLAARYA